LYFGSTKDFNFGPCIWIKVCRTQTLTLKERKWCLNAERERERVAVHEDYLGLSGSPNKLLVPPCHMALS